MLIARLATAAILSVTGVVSVAGSASAVVAPGCGGLPAPVAYRPGGKVITPSPRGAPVACGFGTGFAAAESHIVVTPAGTIVYTPAVSPSGVLGTGEGPAVEGDTQGNATPAGLAVSTDHGAHWAMNKPEGVTWNPTDHGDYVDPRTGRFFFEDYGPIPLVPAFGAAQEGPAHIMWTEDFRSWHHTVVSNLVLPENPRFTSAAAPSGQPAPAGYPSVLYFCANTNVGFTTPAILGRLCYRSLDGGSSWTQRSQFLSAVVPRHPECGANGEVFSAVDGYYPEPTRDGTLYSLVSCGGRTYLARSTDEAATFPIVHTAAGPLSLTLPIDSITSLGSGPQFRIDTSDNFYVAYPVVSGGHLTKLMLMVSSNRGLSWSGPADVTPPGVTSIVRWAAAVRGPGQLAVALIGQRAGQTTFDAYTTATSDALALEQPGPGPLIWSDRTNTQPLLFADHIVGAGNIVGVGEIAVPYPFPLGIQPLAGAVVAGNDFIGATIGPDGTAWGSFDQDCGPGPSATGCVSDKDQTRGFVGSLGTAAVTPSPTPAPTPSSSPPPPPGAPAGPGTGAGGALPTTGASPLVPIVGLAFAMVALGLMGWRRRRA